MRRAFSSAVFLLALVAFGCEKETSPPPANLAAEAEGLNALLASDPVASALEDVEYLVDQERPVHASEQLVSTVIPASTRYRETIDAFAVETSEGRRIKRRLSRALSAREEALTRYATAIGRGAVEDLELAVTFRAQREAEEELLAVQDALLALASGTAP